MNPGKQVFAPLFTEAEKRRLTVPFSKRIRQALRQGRRTEALELCREMAGSRILLHDFYAETCTVLWSWIGRQLGEAELEPMFRFVFHHSAQRQYFDAARGQVFPHLTVALLAKSWRAHSCFGAGEYPGAFHITEDTEKFTFHLHPCGSGARLKLKGWYNTDKPGETSRRARSWTYGRRNFPYYCIHCPFLNEILPFESPYGQLLWPVDPPLNAGDPCAWHIYKDPAAIPERYYRRLELTKPEYNLKKSTRSDRQRHYSDLQLEQLAQPTSDRIIAAILAGNVLEAQRLCREVKDEFLNLHDLYVMMVSSTLTYIARRTGEEGLGKALALQYETCVKEQIGSQFHTLSTREKVQFLAQRFIGSDNCDGSGYRPGRFFIREDQTHMYFVLNPCGSGGRLLRSGSYKAMPRLVRWREAMENALVVSASRRVRLPEKLVSAFFPLMVTHFTQRKPYDQGRCQGAHPWSFQRKDIPYFCCQCGTLLAACRGSGLEIMPPANKKAPCIWKLPKTPYQSPCTSRTKGY